MQNNCPDPVADVEDDAAIVAGSMVLAAFHDYGVVVDLSVLVSVVMDVSVDLVVVVVVVE